MADISKLAFLRTIWVLKDYLADLVIGGGWAPLIYYHYLLGDKTNSMYMEHSLKCLKIFENSPHKLI